MQTIIPCENPAPAGPGAAPTWTRGNKDAIGTAYSTSSRVWFTVSEGILNEIYYPTVDRPQVRDVQYLVTDGETFFHAESQLSAEMESLSAHSPGVRVTRSDPDARYRLVKEIIADPHESSILIHTRFEAAPEWAGKLKLYVLCAPHLSRRLAQ
jgi:glucoamylase